MNWRKVTIPGFENLFKITDSGRVKQTKDIVFRMRCGRSGTGVAKRVLKKGILKPFTSHGYQEVFLRNGKKGRHCRVHILVLEAFRGPCPPGMEARHLDDNRSNNHLSNLRWGTHKQNGRDASRNGKPKKGESHPFSKLSNNKVLKIRRLWKSRNKERKIQFLVEKLATRFNVHSNTIRDVIFNRTWRHVR